MNLIATLLALLLERSLARFPGWGEPSLQRRALRGLRALLPLPGLWQSPLLVLLWLLPPVWGVQHLHQGWESPFTDLLFSTLVLLLCLGPRDLADDVQRWLSARAEGREAEAAQWARSLQRGPAPPPSHRSLLGALFIQSHERLFGVLLGFFALGPAGAVLYRLASRLPLLLAEQGGAESAASRAAESVHALLAYVPARITALLFGLAGSLDDALAAWRSLAAEPEHDWRRDTWAVLAETATGSLQAETEQGDPIVPASLDQAAAEVLALQQRALLILLAFFAFFTTGAWLHGG
ncbi:MAG TPA: regulatory signaling modulator protein AmpE [Nevskiaceae bacterium]|nr:regulatory signaling modulator protein AmpE [Nevskiaceae bacterium]